MGRWPPKPGHERDGTEGAHQVEIELQPDQKEKQGNAEFCKQVDMLVGSCDIEHGRTRQNTDGNEADDEGLA